MHAKDIMTVDVVTVSPEASVREVAGLMLEQHISGVPVVDDSGTLIGIVTEGDLLRQVQLHPRLIANGSPEDEAKAYVKAHGARVRDIMTKDVVTVDEQETQEQIALILEERGIKRVPVMREGSMTGIVSRANLLRSLASGAANGPSDHHLKSLVTTTAQAEAGVRLELVDVMVTDGVVHLWGLVATDEERVALRVVAETTDGVRGVQDHLRILPPSTIDYKPE